MLNFTPEGLAADLFGVLAPYAPPPPPQSLPSVLWGSEAHVRELFGDRVESLEMRRAEYMEQARSPEEYYELFRRTFGPVVAIYTSLADQPERAAELDQAFLDFVTRANRGPRGGPARYRYEHLIVIARKRCR
jgi:2-polyprenyl-6-hydroxyphenyl methylase/3-demethylubiquinone-9 3-methyltransferase